MSELASVTEVDRFRLVDKQIKTYVKSVCAAELKRNKRQRKAEQAPNLMTAEDFHWRQVIDVCRSDCQYTQSSIGSDIGSGRVFDLSSISPGLYLISGALHADQQISLAMKSVEVYSMAEHNNLTNLSSLYGKDQGGMDAAEQVPSSSGTAAPVIPSLQDLWIRSAQEPMPFQTFSKLRWSCLGYHYDWTNRMYQCDLKSPFPPDLAELCARLAASVGQQLTPEAAIVNYYPAGTSMGGHLDDAELTMEHPIVSISLGLPAVFLIGGRQRSTAPTPILLRSGDALIMSGESRYCFHGVPVILPADFPPLLEPEPTHTAPGGAPPDHNVGDVKVPVDDMKQPHSSQRGEKRNALSALMEYASQDGVSENVRLVVRYLQQARININARQVHPSAGETAVRNFNRKPV